MRRLTEKSPGRGRPRQHHDPRGKGRWATRLNIALRSAWRMAWFYRSLAGYYIPRLNCKDSKRPRHALPRCGRRVDLNQGCGAGRATDFVSLTVTRPFPSPLPDSSPGAVEIAPDAIVDQVEQV